MEKKVFFQGLGKKTFALVVALTFWIIANLEFDVERDIRMPLNLTSLPDSLIIVNKQPDSIDLSLRGPRSRLSSFAYSNKTLSVDLSRIRQGSSKIDVKRSASDIVPRGVDIIAARPLKLSLNVDRLVTRKFPVTPVPGEPDSGYEISGQIKAVPEFVDVRGPAGELAKIETIETTKIKMSGEEAEFTVPVSLHVPSPNMEVLQGNLVEVTVNVRGIMVTKEFRDVEVTVRNFENVDYEAYPRLRATLVFNGPYKSINNLKSSEIKVFVDGKEMGNEKKKDLRVNVDYPGSDLLELTSVSPEKITITVKTSPEELSGT